MRGEYRATTGGFTLVELMVAQALGLALIGVLAASLSSLYKSIHVSADAAENSETAYFLMDALTQWLSEARNLPLAAERVAWPISIGGDSVVINDPCGTPTQSPFAFAGAGVAVLVAGNVRCLPSHSVKDYSPVLLIERRKLCGEDCGGAGFYAELSDCGPGRTVPEWRSGDLGRRNIGTGDRERGESELEACDGETQLFQLHRMLIYARDYSHRYGDGVPALMMSRLAAEPEPRWLRSDMLASAVFDWQLRCHHWCDSSEQRQAQIVNALSIAFSVNGRYRSTHVERTMPMAVHWQ